jgi:hypothetical protein
MWLDRSGARLLAFELGRLKRSCFVLKNGIDKPSVPFAALKDADFVLAQIWIGGETGHHKISRIGDRRDTCLQSLAGNLPQVFVPFRNLRPAAAQAQTSRTTQVVMT